MRFFTFLNLKFVKKSKQNIYYLKYLHNLSNIFTSCLCNLCTNFGDEILQVYSI